MFEPEENGTQETPAESLEPKGESAADGGEYRGHGGYPQSIYADAHYEPAGESTVPPRYYTPPAKPVKETREKKKGMSAAGVLALCLICALLGAAGSALYLGERLNSRLQSLEQDLNANAQAIEEVSSRKSAAAETVTARSDTVSDAAMAPAQVYTQALEQAVGITTEVTYTNFFGQTSSSAVSGSGFIIDESGYILTNYHVIEYAYEGKKDVTVMTYDGTKHNASIVGVEPSNDVAVLKIDAEDLQAVSLGDSDVIQVGETVYAVGNPLGELEFSMSTGHISALDRVISTEESESINMFQIDAAVNPGNSGGPLYNSQGQVVGVVTAKYSSTGVEGLGFAIPINDAAAIAEDLITKGYVTGKAYMGVRLDERYNSMYAQYYNMPLGAYVYSVDSGSSAEAAGLRSGDIITKLGDHQVQSYTELKQALRQFHAGDRASLTVYRAGEELTLEITFDEARPSNVAEPPARPDPAAGQ